MNMKLAAWLAVEPPLPPLTVLTVCMSFCRGVASGSQPSGDVVGVSFVRGPYLELVDVWSAFEETAKTW